MRGDVPRCPGVGRPAASISRDEYRYRAGAVSPGRGECPHCHRQVSVRRGLIGPHSDKALRTPSGTGWPGRP